MRLMCCVLMVAFVSGGWPATIAAQERASDPPVAKKLVISERALVPAFVDARREMALQERRDSLKNGAIIGALVGGVALGAFAGFACYAMHEPGNPPCLPGVLGITALGAGIGAAAGAGIDAMSARATPLPLVRVRF